MKVLHVAPSVAQSYGGPTQSLIGFMKAGAAKGIDVSVVAPRPPAVELESLERSLPRESMTLFPAFGTGAFATSPGVIDWVYAHAHEFDVVHAHGLFNPISSLSARAAIRRGVPVVIRPFGTLSRYTFEHRRKNLKRAWLAAVERSNLARAAGLHFTTVIERDEAGWHGIELSRRSHIVPPPFAATMPDVHSLRGNSKQVLFLGRLHPVKRVESIITAWPRVIASEPGANLLIAGSGDDAYRAKLQSLAGAAAAGGSICFEGFVTGSRKSEILARTAVVVLPSLHENFGMVVLECAAAGIPVIVSTHVQLASFVEEEGLGAVLSSEADLAETIVAVLRDARLREHVGTRGRTAVLERFSLDEVGSRLADMYDKVAGRTAKSPPTTQLHAS